MTLQQLKYIVTLSKYKSINEAAKHLFISQPSLSNSIKDLEDELNINIFIRNNKGITITSEGLNFLSYARQIVEQSDLLENKYINNNLNSQKLNISTQHYSFTINVFVKLINNYGGDKYDMYIKETKTHEIIEDVKNLKSELGILYINNLNYRIMNRLFKENNLQFNALFTAKPHIFISKSNPLATKSKVSLKNLEPFPYLYFDQGQYNSFHFSEEILENINCKKTIKVNDRATLFNLLVGLNGYTISTGILNYDLNDDKIIPVPLDIEESITIGYITHKHIKLSYMANLFIDMLKTNALEF